MLYYRQICDSEKNSSGTSNVANVYLFYSWRKLGRVTVSPYDCVLVINPRIKIWPCRIQIDTFPPQTIYLLCCQPFGPKGCPKARAGSLAAERIGSGPPAGAPWKSAYAGWLGKILRSGLGLVAVRKPHVKYLDTKIKKISVLTALAGFKWEISITDLSCTDIRYVLLQFLHCVSTWYVPSWSGEDRFQVDEENTLKFMRRVQP